MLKRGALIVLEGCDKSGKTTQSKNLCERLRQAGHKCELLRFPDRSTTIGRMIDSYLRNTSDLEDRVIHLLFSANRWEAAKGIVSKLQEGITLVVDRYAYSGVAFSAAKKNLDINWCKQPDVGLPKPDLVLFLDIPPEDASKREEFGIERYESVAFQSKVYKNYLLLKEPYWQFVNANQSVEEVHQRLLEHSEKIIGESISKPIGQLWSVDKGTTDNEEAQTS